jgi:hypothetical protein
VGCGSIRVRPIFAPHKQVGVPSRSAIHDLTVVAISVSPVLLRRNETGSIRVSDSPVGQSRLVNPASPDLFRCSQQPGAVYDSVQSTPRRVRYIYWRVETLYLFNHWL